jgi:hypothetical protein
LLYSSCAPKKRIITTPSTYCTKPRHRRRAPQMGVAAAELAT